MIMQTLRGFRDFYPNDQFKVEYIRDKIAEVCRLFGYEAIEGPAIEPSSLYTAKSSEEIIREQAFTFTDRGGEEITLRPEFTPTLARMVAAKRGMLQLPLRWWSFGRFWRYERPQKGRGREFYQWNCDLIGLDSPDADLEILEIVITFLQSVGLTEKEVVIDINDRSLLEQCFLKSQIEPSQYPAAFRLIDRSPKLTEEERQAYGLSLGFDPNQIQALFNTINHLNESKDLPENSSLYKIYHHIESKKLSQWVKVNPSITRGFEYYTGFVFELSDRENRFRSILGGGRYENLVAQVGGEPTSGIGFGMGDMVLLALLEEKQLLPPYIHPSKTVIVSLTSADTWAREVSSLLRSNNIPTILFSGSQSPSEGLRFANRNHISSVIIIGSDEVAQKKVTFKNLASGEQSLIAPEDVLKLLLVS